jgi:biopolymer transport protein ExbD
MAFHLSRRKHEEDEAVGELNIVPYLDIMNLIIFMLLSMAGLATFGMLNVSSRSHSEAPGLEVERPSVTLTVAVGKTGFLIATGDAGSAATTIPRTAQGGYDYDALTAKMQELKLAFPSESKVIIAAAADTDYGVLVATTDATRETPDRKALFPDVTLASF